MRLRKGALDGNYMTQILKAFRRDSSAIVSYESLLSTVVEHLKINNVLRDFVGGDTLRRYRFIHLGKPVRIDKYLYIFPRRADEWA